jgi:mono/diheme cytochrome c family protein
MLRNGAIAFFLFFVLFWSGAAPAQTPPATSKAMSPEVALKNKGIGPIKSVKLGPIDRDHAEDGKELFESKCTACHKLDQRYVGPALSGVTKRRRPEWIMNMILNPGEMVQNDPIAKELLAQHSVSMTFQNVTQEDARKILEYFRSEDAKTPAPPAGGAPAATEPTPQRSKLPGT